jgi:hypothetical protein
MMTNRVKLTAIEGGHSYDMYVCVACGSRYRLEELASIRLRDLLARVTAGAEMPAGECPNADCPDAIDWPYGPAALCYWSSWELLGRDVEVEWRVVPHAV